MLVPSILIEQIKILQHLFTVIDAPFVFKIRAFTLPLFIEKNL